MAKTADNPRSAEHLKEVAIFLKQADKLVREGNHAAALEEIAKARSRDPRNLYALAYEERVRSLVANQKKAETGAASTTTGDVPAALIHISNLAIVEAQRSAAVAAKQEEEMNLRKRDEEERRKNEELRRQAIDSKISMFLVRSDEYLEKKDFERALDEVARAYLLDPANEKVHAAETKIRKLQEAARIESEQLRIQKQKQEEQKRQELLRAQVARMQQEKEEKRRREEEARKNAQVQKIQQYLERARKFLESGRYDDALSELAFVVVIDPLNEDVLSLERKIRDAQEREQQEQLEQYRKREEEQRKKREAIIAAIQKNIENAEMLASKQKWSEALRVITRAYVLDPVNDALQACEKRILMAQEKALALAEEQRRIAEEEVRRQQEEELRRLEQAERERAMIGETAETEAKRRADKEKVLAYITKARAYMADKRYEDALGEVALAFIVNPFDEDVKKIEQDILIAQEKFKSEIVKKEDGIVVDESENGQDVNEQISKHLAEASKLAVEKEFSKALDEIAKAFILDPLNEAIQKFEAQLQKEFHEYQELKHKEEEEKSKITSINKHILRAKEFLERDAFDEALTEVADAYSYDANNADLRELEQKIQSAYQQWKEKQEEDERNAEIENLVFKAKEFLSKDMFDEALNSITQAIVLDPKRESLISMEASIVSAQEVFLTRQKNDADEKEIQKHIFRAKECRVLRSYEEAIAELEQALKINPNKEDVKELCVQYKQEYEEWKAQKALNEKQYMLKQYILKAKEHLSNKIFDEALMEIANGLTIDANNAELLALEEEVIKAQAESENVESSSELVNNSLKNEEQEQLIWIHLRAADELQKQKEFAKALDELAKAYVIDPLNKEIKKAELRVRQNEIRHAQQTGQTLKLVYPNDKVVGGSQ